MNCFDHVELDMPIRHSGRDVKKEVGFMNLESRNSWQIDGARGKLLWERVYIEKSGRSRMEDTEERRSHSGPRKSGQERKLSEWGAVEAMKIK